MNLQTRKDIGNPRALECPENSYQDIYLYLHKGRNNESHEGGDSN